MRYFFAIIVPPLGILLCKRWGHFIVNLFFSILIIPLIPIFGLGFLVWILCIVHALSVCKMSSFDKRLNRVVAAIESRNAQSQAVSKG